MQFLNVTYFCMFVWRVRLFQGRALLGINQWKKMNDRKKKLPLRMNVAKILFTDFIGFWNVPGVVSRIGFALLHLSDYCCLPRSGLLTKINNNLVSGTAGSTAEANGANNVTDTSSWITNVETPSGQPDVEGQTGGTASGSGKSEVNSTGNLLVTYPSGQFDRK